DPAPGVAVRAGARPNPAGHRPSLRRTACHSLPLASCPTCGGTPISGPHMWGYMVPGPAFGRRGAGPVHTCYGSVSPIKTATWLLFWGCAWEREGRWHSLCFFYRTTAAGSERAGPRGHGGGRHPPP